jgi:hypothetical protein
MRALLQALADGGVLTRGERLEVIDSAMRSLEKEAAAAGSMDRDIWETAKEIATRLREDAQ